MNGMNTVNSQEDIATSVSIALQDLRWVVDFDHELSFRTPKVWDVAVDQ